MRVRTILAVLPLVAAGWAVYAFVVVPWQCSHRKRESEAFIKQFAVTEQPWPTRFARMRETSAAIDCCIEHLPNDVDLRMEAAACALILGNTDRAIEQYRAALRSDRRPEIYLELGTALYNNGRRQEAVVAFARIYSFATFIINYDNNLPWSGGEGVLDQIPQELHQDVLRESARQKSLLPGRS